MSDANEDLCEEDLCEVACPGCGEKMWWTRGECITVSCDVCRASAELRAAQGEAADAVRKLDAVRQLVDEYECTCCLDAEDVVSDQCLPCRIDKVLAP